MFDGSENIKTAQSSCSRYNFFVDQKRLLITHTDLYGVVSVVCMMSHGGIAVGFTSKGCIVDLCLMVFVAQVKCSRHCRWKRSQRYFRGFL